MQTTWGLFLSRFHKRSSVFPSSKLVSLGESGAVANQAFLSRSKDRAMSSVDSHRGPSMDHGPRSHDFRGCVRAVCADAWIPGGTMRDRKSVV